jgi:hypothetical protein
MLDHPARTRCCSATAALRSSRATVRSSHAPAVTRSAPPTASCEAHAQHSSGPLEVSSLASIQHAGTHPVSLAAERRHGWLHHACTCHQLQHSGT